MDQNYLRFLEEDCPLKVNAYLNGKLEELEEYQFGLWELENKSFITKIEAEHVALLIVFPPKLNMRISSLLTTGTMSDITFVVRGNEGKEDLPSNRSTSRNRPKCNSSLR